MINNYCVKNALPEMGGKATHARRGVALIITLAMVALLTFITLAFFSKVTSNRQIESASVGTAKADLLARSFAQIVVADLKTEIIAGSNPAIGSGDQPRLYYPITNLNVVPSRNLGAAVSGGPYANLVKQSVGRFFPDDKIRFPRGAPIIQADSNVKTDRLSVNRRIVDGRRWQLAQMVIGNPSGFTTPETLPNWIVVTRAGVKTPQTFVKGTSDNYSMNNSGAVIGRFAFNVYDEGGIVDISVSGYPNTKPTGIPADFLHRKGSLGIAQLGPALGGPSDPPLYAAGGTSAGKFASWRNQASGKAPNDYLAYLGFSKNGATDLTTNAFYGLGPASGFRKAVTTATNADNRLLGRQDLVRLGSKGTAAGVGNGIYGISQQNLSSVSHFNRELNAPSWSPTTPTGSNIKYADLKDDATSANRFFPNVRVQTPFERSTGDISQTGEPLITTRFPLRRLAGLGLTGVQTTSRSTWIKGVLSPATDATIRRDFGLQWDAANGQWKYVGSKLGGSVILTQIATLDAVAKEGREPNFFEILKAGILSGSLGSSSDFESFSSTIGEDSNVDYHIIQIGANIIDQGDTDSYPTRIAFGTEMDPPGNVIAALSAGNPAAPLAGEPKVFCGVEDLPYLQSIVVTPYRIPADTTYLRSGAEPSSPTGKQKIGQNTLDGWLQFVMWKPQQTSPSTTRPTSFRITYKTAATLDGIYLDYVGPLGAAVDFEGLPYDAQGQLADYPKTSPILPNDSTITFVDTPSLFRVPTVLGYSGDSFASSRPQDGGNGGGTSTPKGMWIGEMLRPEQGAGSAANDTAPAKRYVELRCPSDSKFLLEYLDSTNTFRTLQRVDRFGMGTKSSYQGRNSYGFTDRASSPPDNPGGVVPQYSHLDVAQMALSYADPRSQRFGMMAMFAGDGTRNTLPGSMLPPTGQDKWTYFMKQGWSPVASSPFTAIFAPANRSRYAPSWTGGIQENPWGGSTGGNFLFLSFPLGDPPSFFADNDAQNKISHYSNRDLVIRRGDGSSSRSVRPMSLTLTNGTVAANTSALSVVMDRPYQSVGELAYAFRDEPFKTIDFSSPNSADGALLDLFSVNEQPSLVAGKINLNSRNAVVIQSLLTATARQELDPNQFISNDDAAKVAKALVANTSDTSGTDGTGPLINVSDLVARLDTIMPIPNANTADQTIKTRREAVIRAIAGSTQTRTWNLMIDIIAQSGRFGSNATSSEQFNVAGEKRYWLHVAIDRFTGKVIEQQFEPVFE